MQYNVSFTAQDFVSGLLRATHSRIVWCELRLREFPNFSKLGPEKFWAKGEIESYN